MSPNFYLLFFLKKRKKCEKVGVSSHYSAILHLKIRIDARGSQRRQKDSTIFRRMQQKMKKKEVKCSEHRNQNLNGIARDPREQLQQRHSLPPRRGGLWHLTWLLELLGCGGGVGGEWQQVRVLKVRRLAKLHYYLRVSGASRFLRCDFPRGLFGAIYARDFFFLLGILFFPVGSSEVVLGKECPSQGTWQVVELMPWQLKCKFLELS